MRSLSVKAKLIISLAVPTVLIFAFVTVYIGQYIKSSRESDNVILVIQQSIAINALVHEMQAERGLSAAQIIEPSTRLKQQLLAQRLQTDQQLKLFQILVQNNTAIKSLAQQNHAVNQQTIIADIRESVDIDKHDTFELYTRLIANNLKLVSAMQEQVRSEELAFNMDYYVPLIWFKEFASIERGTFHRIYKLESFNQNTLAQLFSLRDKQELIFLQLQRLSPKEFKGDLARLTDSRRTAKVNQMIQQAKFESKKQDVLDEARSYFSLISHYFKSYLLRREPIYYTQFMKIYQDGYKALETYRSMDYANSEIAVLFEILDRYKMVIESLDKQKMPKIINVHAE